MRDGCLHCRKVDLPEKVASNIRTHGLLRPGEKAVVALSAGSDSVALATILAELSKREGWSLFLAHYNHRLRGDEADADAKFAESLGEKLGLPFVFGEGDVAGFAAAKGISIEMAARELRHRFLAAQASTCGSAKVILAHHADDQVELFWLRLLRGNAALATMRWANPSPIDRSITLARPFLNVRKAEILEFLRTRGIPFREDSSNTRAEFERNKLRLEFFPGIEKLRPDFHRATLRVAEVLSAEKEYIGLIARGWLQDGGEAFTELHPAIQRETLRLQLIDAGIKPDFDLIERLRLRANEPTTAEGGQVVVATRGRITRVQQGGATFSDASLEVAIGTGGSVEWEGVKLEWAVVPGRGSGNRTEFFDAERVGNKVTLRHWQPGDRFQPIGMPGSAKLQDIFVSAKIPRQDRVRLVVAVTESGTIFWVEGLRIGEQCKIVRETKRILRWTWRRPPETEQ